MKKALLAALCFIIVGLVMVNGTFALPSIEDVFKWVKGLGDNGKPEQGGPNTAVHVELDSDQTPQNLYPGSEVSRAFHVQNHGTGDVYFRLVYAVQYDEESWSHLDIDFAAGNGFTEHDWEDITIGNTPYKMKVFTYTNALPVGSASPEVSITIGMDAAVTSEQVSRYRSDFLQTQVLAIGAGDFTADRVAVSSNQTLAEAALDLALPLDTLSPF